MSERLGHWQQTYPTATQFWSLDPRPEEIHIEDIAHALSLQCRFAGHVKHFYSVAQHSWYVSQNVPPEFALWGLLHDSAEAYLGDMIRPLKKTKELGLEYCIIERQLMTVIAKKFGLSLEHVKESTDLLEPAEVIEADQRILMTEKRDIVAPPQVPWGEMQGYKVEPYDFNIIEWSPRKAEVRFLDQFSGLMR